MCVCVCVCVWKGVLMEPPGAWGGGRWPGLPSPRVDPGRSSLMLPAGWPPDPVHPQMLPITAKGSVSHPDPPGHTGRTAPMTSSTAAATASRSGSPATAGRGRPEGFGCGGLPPPAWPPGSPGTAAPMSGLTGFSPGGLWKSQTAGAGRGR